MTSSVFQANAIGKQIHIVMEYFQFAEQLNFIDSTFCHILSHPIVCVTPGKIFECTQVEALCFT
ncbi:MAG: hypothetical protein LN588_05370 [Rickettsia endosymbiont of Bryobia graminum]|nr:hypothetical protein [Rickettsia endosymbiont of Bryobia graminum]